MSRKIFIGIILITISTLFLCQGHGHGKAEGKKGKAVRVADKEHIKEHLKEETNVDTADMSQEELEFYEFKLHDYDNSSSLDGLEVYKSISHDQEDMKEDEDNVKVDKEDEDNVKVDKEDQKKPEEISKEVMERENEFAEEVDEYLERADEDEDGYITYIEYKTYIGSAAKEEL